MARISVSTLYRYFNTGIITRRKIGNRTLVSHAEIAAMIDGPPVADGQPTTACQEAA